MALSVQYDHSLLKNNTFGIEARADCYIEYHSVGELEEALEILRDASSGKILNIGSGSNLLFCGDFKGAVLRNRIETLELETEDSSSVAVRAGGGWLWDAFVSRCIREGWYGAENLSSIPGTVGASAVQNIGAYGAEVADLILKVEAVDSESGEKCVFPVDECRYAYRDSIFKRREYKKYIITHVHYRLSRDFVPNLTYRALSERFGNSPRGSFTAADIRCFVAGMRRDKLPDPAVLGNAGSFFMNPVVSREDFEKLSSAYPDIPHFDAVDASGKVSVKLSAAWLIDRAGWKGRSLGPAGVYGKQPLVLVNLGGATGSDILALAGDVISDVRRKFGVELAMEVNAIGK